MIHGIGSSGLFASRAFLPAFITALLLRFGPEFEWLASRGILQNVQGAPTWFTHDVTLWVLGVLSAAEILLSKNAEAREILNELDRYLKSGMSVLTYIGLVNATDAKFVDQAVQEAGFGDLPIVVVIGAAVYFLSTIRSKLFGVLIESDNGDEIGIQRLISWGEDIWSTVGLVFLFLFPFVMILLIALTTGFIVALQKLAERREEKAKVACAKCDEMISPAALQCPKCTELVANPKQVGFLGQSTTSPVLDQETQPFRLVEAKRCPVCATRFTARDVHQTCEACQHQLMSDPQFAEAYIQFVNQRLAVVCGVTFALSLIPVIGLIPGVIYYRMKLVAPFRRYMPLGRRFLLKWMLRLFCFGLIALQWIPLVGGLAVPTMAATSYLAYRISFRDLAIPKNGE